MRDGIDQIYKSSKSEEDYDLFGAKTLFRAVTSKMVEGVLSEGKWFSFCTKIRDSQVDIMSMRNKDGEKIGSFAADIYPGTVYRSAIYKYLLRDYLCYYEAPAINQEYYSNSGYKAHYDKFLATSNLEVISRWLDISLEEAEMLYGSRIEESCEDNECDLFPYVKLYKTKEGVRKVTKPRKDIDLCKIGTRIIPLYALKIGVDYLYKEASKDFMAVDFVKDGGADRGIVTTFNTGKLRELYGETDFFREGVQGMYDGDFEYNNTLENGYIRVFEAGASKYDSPLRAINYARITGFRKADPDLTFINIDINKSIESFKMGLHALSVPLGEVIDMLILFDVGSEEDLKSGKINTTSDLENWADGQQILLGTVFLRKLALFMIGASTLFDDIINCNMNTKSVSTGDELDDFEFDLT